MTESAIITALVGAVVAGAGSVWLFLQGELKKRDVAIEKLNAKVDEMNKIIIDLTDKYSTLKGRNEAVDSINQKLDQLILTKKRKKTV